MTTLTGRFTLPAPRERALHFFTPLGEKEWAAGWDPVFPSAEGETVFQTSHGHHKTTWVVVDRNPGHRIRYARVAHGMTAGTVEVTLEDRGGASEITVTYELTALGEQGRAHLAEFAKGYDAYLRSWQQAITSVLP